MELLRPVLVLPHSESLMEARSTSHLFQLLWLVSLVFMVLLSQPLSTPSLSKTPSQPRLDTHTSLPDLVAVFHHLPQVSLLELLEMLESEPMPKLMQFSLE